MIQDPDSSIFDAYGKKINQRGVDKAFLRIAFRIKKRPPFSILQLSFGMQTSQGMPFCILTKSNVTDWTKFTFVALFLSYLILLDLPQTRVTYVTQSKTNRKI